MPGGAPGGITLDLAEVHESGVAYVAYLHAAANGLQRLAVRRLSTGAVKKVTSEAVYPVTRIGFCADEQDLCVNGFRASDLSSGVHNWRVDLGTGEMGEDHDVTVPANSRLLGERIYSTSGRTTAKPELLGYVQGGKSE